MSSASADLASKFNLGPIDQVAYVVEDLEMNFGGIMN